MPPESTMLPARYSDPELVARGGMGEVYRATDTSLGRAVAIKILDERLAADDTVRKRFAREAHTAARLSGESGVVTIFDVGEWNGRPFIVMEYVRGGSLQDVLEQEGPQPPSVALRWLEQTAYALDDAHERGIVHRDVKPSNLLLDKQDRVHVADFGVALAAGLDSLTVAGTVIGTAGYLSPEQAQGHLATPASDQYALAVVAYELLAGVRPFENDNPTAEAAAHVHGTVPPLSTQSDDVPPRVDSVFARALAKDPARRYPSCGAFVRELRAAFTDTADWPAALPLAALEPRRRVWPFVLALLALAGLATGIVIGTQRGGDSAAQLRTVTRQGRPVTITQQATTVQTVTSAAAQPPPATTPATTAPSSAPPTGNGEALALAGYDKLKAGDYAGALPLLQQAAQQLDGTGSTSEAYNDYNLAYALAKTSGCSPDVIRLLDASEAIQGHRTEIDRLRTSCRG